MIKDVKICTAFDNFTITTWICILTNSLGGLLVGVVIMTTDAVTKDMAIGSSIAFASIASIFLFSYTPNYVFICGVIIVIVGISIYGRSGEYSHFKVFLTTIAIVILSLLVYIIYNASLPLQTSRCPDPCNRLHIESNKVLHRNRFVMVTGGAGFIGSNLVDKLLSNGYFVRVFDNFVTGDIRYMPIDNKNLEVMYGSVSDYDAIYKAISHPIYVRNETIKLSGIFHLAAMSKVGPSLKDPSIVDLCISANVQGTANVLRALLEAKKRGLVEVTSRVVYAGSSTYYGNGKLPFQETDLFDPTSTYAASKYQGELLMQTWDRTYDIPTVTLRFFMVWGPRQPRSGAYAIVTGIFADQRDYNKPLTIEGDGSHFRDFVHVEDIARALILAFQSTIRNSIAINIGTGKIASVQDIANLISSNQSRLPPRLHDLVGTCADTCRAKKVLGFEAEHDIIKELDEYLKESRFQLLQSKNRTSSPIYIPSMSKIWENISYNSLDEEKGTRSIVDLNAKMRTLLQNHYNGSHPITVTKSGDFMKRGIFDRILLKN